MITQRQVPDAGIKSSIGHFYKKAILIYFSLSPLSKSMAIDKESLTAISHYKRCQQLHLTYAVANSEVNLLTPASKMIIYAVIYSQHLRA